MVSLLPRALPILLPTGAIVTQPKHLTVAKEKGRGQGKWETKLIFKSLIIQLQKHSGCQ